MLLSKTNASILPGDEHKRSSILTARSRSRVGKGRPAAQVSIGDLAVMLEAPSVYHGKIQVFTTYNDIPGPSDLRGVLAGLPHTIRTRLHSAPRQEGPGTKTPFFLGGKL